MILFKKEKYLDILSKKNTYRIDELKEAERRTLLTRDNILKKQLEKLNDFRIKGKMSSKESLYKALKKFHRFSYRNLKYLNTITCDAQFIIYDVKMIESLINSQIQDCMNPTCLLTFGEINIKDSSNNKQKCKTYLCVKIDEESLPVYIINYLQSGFVLRTLDSIDMLLELSQILKKAAYTVTPSKEEFERNEKLKKMAELTRKWLQYDLTDIVWYDILSKINITLSSDKSCIMPRREDGYYDINYYDLRVVTHSQQLAFDAYIGADKGRFVEVLGFNIGTFLNHYDIKQMNITCNLEDVDLEKKPKFTVEEVVYKLSKKMEEDLTKKIDNTVDFLPFQYAPLGEYLKDVLTFNIEDILEEYRRCLKKVNFSISQLEKEVNENLLIEYLETYIKTYFFPRLNSNFLVIYKYLSLDNKQKLLSSSLSMTKIMEMEINMYSYVLNNYEDILKYRRDILHFCYDMLDDVLDALLVKCNKNINISMLKKQLIEDYYQDYQEDKEISNYIQDIITKTGINIYNIIMSIPFDNTILVKYFDNTLKKLDTENTIDISIEELLEQFYKKWDIDEKIHYKREDNISYSEYLLMIINLTFINPKNSKMIIYEEFSTKERQSSKKILEKIYIYSIEKYLYYNFYQKLIYTDNTYLHRTYEMNQILEKEENINFVKNILFYLIINYEEMNRAMTSYMMILHNVTIQTLKKVDVIVRKRLSNGEGGAMI